MKCLSLLLISVTLVASQDIKLGVDEMAEKAAFDQQQRLHPSQAQTNAVFDDTILYNISFVNLVKNQTEVQDAQVKRLTSKMIQVIQNYFPIETSRKSYNS